ncbi:MAG: Rpn family recombination-promoting nuclease/putative transposase, partial [Cyanobacteria bacterium J06573_2]
GRVNIIYLDELRETTSLPVGIATIKLIIEDENTAIVAARDLIGRTQQEINSELQQRQLLELIETILVYKFPRMNRKEIEKMFGLSDLKQTRVYQEGVEEGKEEGIQQGRIESIPRLLKLGLSIEQIAQGLDLDLEEVRKQVENQNK